MSAGHSSPGTATRWDWDSPSFPLPILATPPSPPRLCMENSPLVLQAGGYGATTHPAPLSLASPGGSALLHSSPLFSSTQIPPSLPPVCPGLSFLPHIFPSSSRAHCPGGGTPPVRVSQPGRGQQAGPCGRARRQRATRAGGHGVSPAQRRAGRQRSALWDAEPPALRALLRFVLFNF